MKEELADFWFRRRENHPLLNNLALNPCKQGFSSIIYLKNKYGSRISDLDLNLRLKLTKIQQDFTKLTASKQSQCSY